MTTNNPDEARLSPEAVARLAHAQAAHLANALVSDEARARFGMLVAGALAGVLARPLATLVDLPAVTRALAAAATGEVGTKSLAPLVRALGERLGRALEGRRETLGDFVPHAARRELDGLLAEPGLLDAELVRAVGEDPAIEAAMRDVLYDALSEFSRNVNPFFADWGLPGLLDKFFPFGKGALKKGLTGMREDFERRLEPETRKFIGGFARRALRKLCESAIEKNDEPEAIALRQRIAALVLARPLGALVWPADDAKSVRLRACAAAVLGAGLESAAFCETVERALAALLAEHGARSVAELCHAWGVALPDPQPLAAALWPLAQAFAASPAVRAELERLLGESLGKAALGAP